MGNAAKPRESMRENAQGRKIVFTTGEAARICKVSQQTIIRCFDSGKLKGFRVPGTRFRRIPRDILYKFMKDNGIPTDELKSGKTKVDTLIEDSGQDVMHERFDRNVDFHHHRSTFDLGAGIKEAKPDMVVVDENLAEGHIDRILEKLTTEEILAILITDKVTEEVRKCCFKVLHRDDYLDQLADASAEALEIDVH